MRNIFTSLGIFFITSSLVAQGGNQSAFSGNKDIPKLDLHLQNPAPDKSKFMEDNKEGRALAFGYFDFDSKNLNSFLDTTSSVNSTFASNYMGISLDNFSLLISVSLSIYLSTLYNRFGNKNRHIYSL